MINALSITWQAIVRRIKNISPTAAWANLFLSVAIGETAIGLIGMLTGHDGGDHLQWGAIMALASMNIRLMQLKADRK